jgi:hypothetical protein
MSGQTCISELGVYVTEMFSMDPTEMWDKDTDMGLQE